MSTTLSPRTAYKMSRIKAVIRMSPFLNVSQLLFNNDLRLKFRIKIVFFEKSSKLG